MHDKFFLIFLTFFGIASPVQADFLETTWIVEKFAGEPWFLDPSNFLGETQSFQGGYADGVFYACNYDGQSMTYTSYDVEDFFENAEFRRFESVHDEISLGATTVFVHRVTCARPDGESHPAVLYPFVTNDVRDQAWYLIEGVIFSLRH
jgi:hypothetical protein